MKCCAPILAILPMLACGSVTSADDAGADATSADAGPTFLLTITSDSMGLGRISTAGGEIDCGSVCEARLPAGSTVTLTAEPSATGIFDRWTGACAGTDTTCGLVLDGDRQVGADFSALTAASIQVTGSMVNGGGSEGPVWHISDETGTIGAAVSDTAPTALFVLTDFEWTLTQPLAVDDYLVLTGSEGSAPLTRTFIFKDADGDAIATHEVMITASNGSGDIIRTDAADVRFLRFQFLGRDSIDTLQFE